MDMYLLVWKSFRSLFEFNSVKNRISERHQNPPMLFYYRCVPFNPSPTYFTGQPLHLPLMYFNYFTKLYEKILREKEKWINLFYILYALYVNLLMLQIAVVGHFKHDRHFYILKIKKYRLLLYLGVVRYIITNQIYICLLISFSFEV